MNDDTKAGAGLWMAPDTTVMGWTKALKPPTLCEERGVGSPLEALCAAAGAEDDCWTLRLGDGLVLALEGGQLQAVLTSGELVADYLTALGDTPCGYDLSVSEADPVGDDPVLGSLPRGLDVSTFATVVRLAAREGALVEGLERPERAAPVPRALHLARVAAHPRATLRVTGRAVIDLERGRVVRTQLTWAAVAELLALHERAGAWLRYVLRRTGVAVPSLLRGRVHTFDVPPGITEACLAAARRRGPPSRTRTLVGLGG